METSKLGDGHLWLHFTAAGDWLAEDGRVPVLDSGKGCYVWDDAGRRYLDGLSALFCVQVGYGREEMPAAADAQMRKLPFATNWGTGPTSRPSTWPPRWRSASQGTWSTRSSSTPGPRRWSRR